MNLTIQYIVSPKSREAYFNSDASYKSIRTTSTRLRLSEDRYVLNSRKKRVSFQVDGIGFNMLYCPIGQFKMGYENLLTKIESPFLLGETEVTQELFKTIMGYNPSNFQGQGYPNSKQRPVEMVTWYDALMFCNKLSLKLGKRPYYNINEIMQLRDEDRNTIPNQIGNAKVTINPHSNGFRLPIGKEWEYAAKAGTNNKYAGTNDDDKLDEVAWYFNFNGSNDQTRPVKCKRANEWGFYDMSGNVKELIYEFDSLGFLVCRGGSWDVLYSNLMSELHTLTSPGSFTNSVGFRISASLVN
jgi:sulfatase modifying factor 1